MPQEQTPARRWINRIAAATAAVISSSIGVASSSPSEQERPFAGSVDVEVVTVEVWVTDRDGRPVHGLGPEGFELVVDGDPVPLSNFSAPTRPPEQTSEPEQAKTEAEQAPSFLVVFVDHANMLRARRSEVLGALEPLVRECLARGDRLMIVSNDDHFEVLSEFDDTPAGHLIALMDADRTSPAALMTETEYGRILRCIETSCSESAMIRTDIDVYARQLRQRARTMLTRLAAVIDRMSALPGRRAVLFVGDSVAARPAESLYTALLGRATARVEANRFRLGPDLEELTDLANARRVTLYTLNTGGIIGAAAQQANRTMFATIAVSSIEIGFVREANASATLQRLAEDTGGQVLFKPTAETIEAIDQDLETAYLLGFVPEHGPDDRQHRIEVRVTGDGYRVRHRESYQLMSDEGQAAVQTRLALVLAQTSNSLGIEAEFGSPAERDRRKRVVPVAIRVPIGSITTVPAGHDTNRGRLEFLFQAEDEDGNSTPLLDSELPLEFPDEAVEAEGPLHITYDVGLKVRPGHHRVALTVTDVLGGESSTLAWNLMVREDGTVRASPR